MIMDVKEFQIAVPWGFVAVKAWGNEKYTPVLMVHGVYDNAGSFDQLVPNLLETFYYICIDLPGHGKSSPFPPHLPLNPIHFVLTYKIVMDYLNRDKYIVIAHSWGGRMAMLFAQLYPDCILKIIILDAVYLPILSISDFKQYIVEQQNQISQINKKILIKSPSSYTYEEALKRLRQSRAYGGELKREVAEALLKRSLIPAENGKLRFSTDLRLKVTAVTALFYDRQFVERLMRKFPIMCPILFIIASESTSRLQDDTVLKELQRVNRKCFIRKVEGTHDVHMNEPEMVAPIINTFLKYSISKL